MPWQSKREWKPLEEHSCTDIPWLIIFTLFCIGMACICGYPIATGGAARLVFGYDSYGNTCGKNNTKIEGVPLSGRDMTENKFVFFLDPCNIDLINRKIKSIALCVSKCPSTELTTYSDLKQFALNNGSNLCSYDLTPTRYTTYSSEKSTKCPKLPVPPSKSVLLFRRCIPTDISCYTQFAKAFMTFVSDNTVLQRVISGVMASKEIIIGLCILALGITPACSMRFAFMISAAPLAQLEFLTRIQKRVALTISLFHVAGKVFIHLPLLVLQPFWTFLCLILFWIYWIGVLLFLGTTGTPVKNNSTGVVGYEMQGPLQFLVWYHVVGLIWISEFILAFQQMTIAGAVVTYYFTRNKSQMPATPIISSMARTIRYHLGTLAKGSFIITLVKIPRLILTYIHSQLKGKENACARCMVKACVCCLWCLEKCLAYLNQNAYTATAINSTSFCTSAREAFLILVENALRVAAINTVGDFVLFLGKILIVSCTAFAGVLALNYQRDYTVWVLPLLIVCVFAFLVAHCFLSVFENVVDVLFLCFAVDTKYNDGSPGREYYMDKEFVENSKKMGWKKPDDGDGREMKPMVS
uniref:Choline transporter-like protein n=1 Tax=Astatotilapia calliptera TaxID=8154 RepID=A0AAX7UNA5_ASTCA